MIDLEQIEPELQAVALICRARIYVSCGRPDLTFEDVYSIGRNSSYSSQRRLESIVGAAKVSGSYQDRLERVCSAAQAFVASARPEQRKDLVIDLLIRLCSPETAPAWLRVWRAVSRDQSQDVLPTLAFLNAVADILEGRDRSVLNPLPPEQRAFAEEILGKLRPPVGAGAASEAPGVAKSFD